MVGSYYYWILLVDSSGGPLSWYYDCLPSGIFHGHVGWKWKWKVEVDGREGGMKKAEIFSTTPTI